MRSKLYSYRSKLEFDKYYNENTDKVYGYDIIDSNLNEISNYIIDITDLIQYLNNNPLYIYTTRLKLMEIAQNNKIIISSKLVDTALNIFPLVFDDAEPIYDKIEEKTILERNIRHKIYYYNSDQFEKIENNCNEKNIILTNFANINLINKYDNDLIIDITTTLQSIKGAEHIVYLLEQFFSTVNSKTTIIVDVVMLEEVKKYLKLTFNEFLDISKLFDNIPKIDIPKNESKKIRKIIDLTEEEILSLVDSINNKLIGHDNFKKKLNSELKKFLLLNKINKRKIFSLFLLGKPGLGKTEIGRIISKEINYTSNLIKINFGNYSSQDALNSLIGSPAGYIGCDGGELSNKIKKNPVGVIICDEFEKADSEIKNFFLELLEDGKFTDSMGREYDLNGYIILFTSNIENENQFDKTMSPEFKSRINLICQFTPLNDKDKEDYITYQIDSFKRDLKLNKIKHKKIPKKINIRYDDTDDLRELKDRVYNKMQEYIE